MPANRIIEEHLSVIQALSANCLPAIEKAACVCRQALENGNTIYFCGNGGSAADSQHIAAELVGRFQKERRGYPGIALTTDTSILTAVGNDYGYDHVFARQVEALVKAGDVVVGLSTSGNSHNVVMALEQAKILGASTIGMTGRQGGKMGGLCDVCIQAPSDITARIQEAHILVGHIICEILDEVSDCV